MFHRDEPLRGKYLVTFNRQLLDEIEAARRRESPPDDDSNPRHEMPEESLVISSLPTTHRIPEGASGR